MQYHFPAFLLVDKPHTPHGNRAKFNQCEIIVRRFKFSTGPWLATNILQLARFVVGPPGPPTANRVKVELETYNFACLFIDVFFNLCENFSAIVRQTRKLHPVEVESTWFKKKINIKIPRYSENYIYAISKNCAPKKRNEVYDDFLFSYLWTTPTSVSVAYFHSFSACRLPWSCP